MWLFKSDAFFILLGSSTIVHYVYVNIDYQLINILSLPDYELYFICMNQFEITFEFEFENVQKFEK